MKIIIIGLIIFIANISCADTVYFNNGAKIDGDIKSISDDEVKIDVPMEGFEGIYEPKIIKQSDIERIEEKDIVIPKKQKTINNIRQENGFGSPNEDEWAVQEENEEDQEQLEESGQVIPEEQKSDEQIQFEKYYQQGIGEYEGAVKDWNQADKLRLKLYTRTKHTKTKLSLKKDALGRLNVALSSFERARRYGVIIGRTSEAKQVIDIIEDLEKEWKRSIKELEEELRKLPKEK